jgi:hypothetical protein
MDPQIRAGENFYDVLKEQVSSCDFFVALIGHHWLADAAEKSKMQIEDFVLLEIQWALQTNRRIVPVLVDGATMPPATALPAALDRFARCQALKIASEQFSEGAGRLMAAIRKLDSEKSQPSVEGYAYIRSKGWTGVDLAAKLQTLDFEIIEGVTRENEAPVDALGPIFEEYTQTWRILVDRHTEDIVGYWRFVPLLPKIYERARAGKLLDSELTSDVMRYFGLPGTYDIYIAAMAIRRRYRNGKGDRKLFTSFLDILTELAKEEIFIGKICANGLTETGEKLCQGVGMEFKTTHEFDGKIYEGDIVNILRGLETKSKHIFQDYKELITRYCSENAGADA